MLRVTAGQFCFSDGEMGDDEGEGVSGRRGQVGLWGEFQGRWNLG